MIGYIKGTIDTIGEDHLLIENQGIGWRVVVPSSLLDSDVREGDHIKLYTYLHVREDAMQLFGFFEEEELRIFRLLLNVSGIGPKGAVSILSAVPVDDLRFAVLAEDVDRIARAPGVGKKTAQKLILELKDKFHLEEAFEQKLARMNEGGAEGLPNAEESAGNDAVQALIALGYSGTEALQAVRKVHAGPDMDSEAILKEALKSLF